MGQQFPDVNCSRGAPMGRSEQHNQPDEPRSVRLFEVRLNSQGYDDGGAYWGLSKFGESLFCATGPDGYREFTRARSRNHAVCLLGIDPATLCRPMENSSRTYLIWPYQVQKEFDGNPKPQWVVRDLRNKTDGYFKYVRGFDTMWGATGHVGGLLKEP